MRDLWMWGITPPPAMVALMRVSSSSSPRMASWRWRGVMRLTCGFSDRAGGGVGQNASSSRFFVARRKRTEKRFSNGFKTRPGGLSTGRVRDPERKRAGKRRGRAVRAAMSAGRTLRSLEALPASSRTSAVRYSAGRESERESCERPRVSESSWKQRLSNRRGWLEGTRRRRARAGRRGDAPRIAAEYTAAVAPTRPPEAARF